MTSRKYWKLQLRTGFKCNEKKSNGAVAACRYEKKQFLLWDILLKGIGFTGISMDSGYRNGCFNRSSECLSLID